MTDVQTIQQVPQQIQQQQQQNAPSMQAPPMMQYQAPRVDQDCKLHIADLHDSITEEILWKTFKTYGNITKIKVARDRDTQKSRNYAKITFQSSESAKEARTKLNYSYLLKQEILPNQKRIAISKDIDHDKFQVLKSKNIFITGLPQEIVDPNQIYGFLTKFGDILSLQLTYKKDQQTLAGFGFVLYEKSEDNEKLIESKTQDYNGSELTFTAYLPPNKREHTLKKNYYLKDFYRELTDAELSNEENQKAALAIVKEDLSKKLSSYGNITSIIINVDPTSNKKVYAFICFGEDSQTEQLDNDYKQEGKAVLQEKGFPATFFMNLQVSKQIKTTEERFLLIKSLKIKEEEYNDALEANLKEQLSKYGLVESVSVSKSTKPGEKPSLQDAHFARVIMKTDDDATKVIINYQESKEFQQFFIGDKPYGNITYCLPKADRQRMLRSKQQQRQRYNVQQQAQMAVQQSQMYQQQSFMQNPMNNFRGYNRNNSQPGGGKRQYPQQQQPRGGQGYQNNNYNNRQQNNGGRQGQQPLANNRQGQVPQGAQPVRPTSQQPKPVATKTEALPGQSQSLPAASAQPAAPITLEQLKQNIDKFTQVEKKQQSQILGNLLFPKVNALCEKENYNKTLAPKITGMLIDFSVFEVTDILETLENEHELLERVKEAVQLINSQQQQQ